MQTWHCSLQDASASHRWQTRTEAIFSDRRPALFRESAPNFPLTRARLASDTESPVFTELAPQTAVPRNQCAFTTGAGRDTGEQGHDGGNYPCLSKRRAAETKMHFHNSIMWYGLSKSIWNKFIAVIRGPRKFRMVFYNLCYYSWSQHSFWTEISILGNDFFLFFISFYFPQLFYYPPLPYRWSGVPGCSALRKTHAVWLCIATTDLRTRKWTCAT